MTDFPRFPCQPVSLPDNLWEDAKKVAVAENPANKVVSAPPSLMPTRMLSGALRATLSLERIAVMTNKYWGARGVRLGVTFLDNPDAETRRRVLHYANLWGEGGRVNAVFSESADGQVRVSREPGGGYASYLGTDILLVQPGRPTMWLEGVTAATPSDAECMRVIPHEFGHTLGCVHEHARRAVVEQLSPRKVVKVFRRDYGWTAMMTYQQVLTPIEEAELLAGPVEEDSVMCYWFSGECTRDGQPIVGGKGITAGDYAKMASLYPVAVTT